MEVQAKSDAPTTGLASGSSSSSVVDNAFRVITALTFILVFISVIIGGVTLQDVGDCSDGDETTCAATIETISSVSAMAPLCDATCAQVNYHHLLGPKYYLYYYLLGPMTRVKSDITGDETLYSDNMGAINDLQPLLCNYTASTGNTTATVFQYDDTTEEFTRVITTVPKVSVFLCLHIFHRHTEHTDRVLLFFCIKGLG
jgi:hypothetical protein